MRYGWLAIVLLGCNGGGGDDGADTEVVDTDEGGGGGGGNGGTDTDGSGGGDTDRGGGDTDGGGGDTDAVDTDTDVPDTDTDTGPGLPPIGLYADDHAVSGTRLQRIAVEDTHGNVALAWFHDTELDVDCTVRKASDGVLRCLPEATPFGGTVISGVYYGDSACTAEVALVYDSCGSLGYLTDAGDPEKIYTSGGYYPNVYQQTARGCGGAVKPSGTSASALTLVDPTEFVGFERVGEAVDADLGVEVLEGDDGSRVVVGLWSVAEDQPAQVYAGHAVPYRDTAGLDGLVRSSCASGIPDAYVGADEGYRPAYVLLYGQVPGPNPWSPPLYVENLHPITGESATWCDNGVTTNAPAGTKVYTVRNLGTSLSTFPTVQIRTDAGSGQRLRHLSNAAGTPITPWPASGGVQVEIGGVLREVGRWDDRAAALPAGYGAVNYFGDPGCTQAIESAQAGWTSGQVMLRQHGNPTCRSLPGAPTLYDGVWTVPASTSGSNRTIYTGSPGQCYEVGMDVFYALTDASGSAGTVLPEPALADPALAPAP